MTATKSRIKRVLPFVPYMGGKRRLVDTLLANSPTSYRNYHEPFLGGGAMALAVMDRYWRDTELGYEDGKRVFFLSDFDREIAEMWTIVKEAPRELESALRSFLSLHSEERFDAVRDWTDEMLDSVGIVARAARAIYLRKTSFGSKVVRSKEGKLLAAFAIQRQAVAYDYANLHAVSRLLNALDTRIAHASYEVVLDNAKPGDFIYLDPPYAEDADDGRPVTSNYMTGVFDQTTLKDVVERATRRGAYTLMSNSYTATTRELWDGWACIRKEFLHIAGEKRVTTELIVANWRLAERLVRQRQLAESLDLAA